MMEQVPTKAQIKSLLNSMAILTRIMPYVYELESHQFERELFWTVTLAEANRANHPEKKLDIKTPEAFNSPIPQEEPLAPLGERLLRALVNLLFFPGFTLPANLATEDKRIRYVIWYSP